MTQEDWMLMHRVAAGEEKAIAELYDRFGSLVYKVAMQVLSSRVDAEDAVQEVFIRLWQTADRYDPRRAKLVTWVMLIARRHLIDRLRRQAVRPTMMQSDSDLAGDDDAQSPSQSPELAERNEELLRRIAQLPELQRLVIERAYLQGFTLREVSEQLDAPLGTVKSALSRGLNKLRERGEAEREVS